MENFFYYAEICESLNDLWLIFVILGLSLSFGFFIARLVDTVEKDEDVMRVKKTIKWFKVFIISSSISIILYIVTPTKETLYLMKGFGIIENTLNDSTAKHLPSKTIELLNEYLDNELKKFKENNK